MRDVNSERNTSKPFGLRQLMGISIVVIAVSAIVATYVVFSQPLAPSTGEIRNEAISMKPQKSYLGISAAWDNYPTFKELADNSTDIVVGQITSIKMVDDKSMPPITDYNFRIDLAIKGDLQVGNTITIRQIGAETAEQIAELSDDPLIKEGERFLGFLDYSKEHDVYAIVGGPQGRYLLENGSISSLDTVNPHSDWIPIKADRKDLSEFVQEIKSEMTTK